MHGFSTVSGRLTRSSSGHIAGVCGGLGEHFGVSATLLRVVWAAAVLLFGTGVLLYLILWWVVPRQDAVPVEPTLWLRAADGRHHPPLARTGVDRKLLGVCGGLARRWDLDPSIVRLATLALFTLSGGLVLVVYLVAALLMRSSSAALQAQAHPVQL